MAPLIGFDLTAEGARSKKGRDDDDAPTQVPMRPDPKVARNPSTDQKKVRHQMARQAAKESTMDTSTTREAQLLAAMSKASLAEQRQLAADLHDLRMARQAALDEDRDTGLANAFIRDTLTPVATHVIHTASTDWLDEVADYGTEAPESMTSEVTAEATLWFGRVHTAVRADREEFAEQAMGMARRTASRFGPFADSARAAFLERVAFLHKQAEDRDTNLDEIDTSPENWPLDDDEKDQKPNTTPWTEQQSTKDSRDFSALPGTASALDDEFAFVAHDSDRSDYPAHEQAGFAESGLPVEPTGDTEKTFDEIINGDLPSTGPVEVPSDRAPVIKENEDGRTAAVDIAACSKCGKNKLKGKRCQHCGAGGDHKPAWNKASSKKTAAEHRSLSEIAADIRRDWKNVNYGAVPYLDAMRGLDKITDSYYQDSAASIVTYFLSNATTWRGEVAKAIKAELKAMLKARYGSRHTADARSDYDHLNEDADWAWWQEEGRHGSEPPEEVDDGYMDWNPDEDEEEDEEEGEQFGNPGYEPSGDMAYSGSRRTAGEDNGNADSSLDDVEVGDEDDRPMWPWELGAEVQTGDDAANVKKVRTPGGEAGYPQPTAARQTVAWGTEAGAQVVTRQPYDLDGAPEAERNAYWSWVSQMSADSDSGYYVPLNFKSWRSQYWDESKGDTTYAGGLPPMASSLQAPNDFLARVRATLGGDR